MTKVWGDFTIQQTTAAHFSLAICYFTKKLYFVYFIQYYHKSTLLNKYTLPS